METIAIYREEIIKTYGLFERTGLCLLVMDLPSKGVEAWGIPLMEMLSPIGVSPVLLMARPLSADTLCLRLLLEETEAGSLRIEKGKDFFDRYQVRWHLEPAVELVYFQGPHYGDRYGIASAALSALVLQEVPVLAVVCTGASVFLILPLGKGGPARKALARAFVTPENV
jgi:hypothetical protein